METHSEFNYNQGCINLRGEGKEDTDDEQIFSGANNILYKQNFFHFDEMCAAWTWYLALDFQFFVLTVPVLVVFVLVPPLAAVSNFLIYSPSFLALKSKSEIIIIMSTGNNNKNPFSKFFTRLMIFFACNLLTFHSVYPWL